MRACRAGLLNMNGAWRRGADRGASSANERRSTTYLLVDRTGQASLRAAGGDRRKMALPLHHLRAIIRCPRVYFYLLVKRTHELSYLRQREQGLQQPVA